MKTINFTSKLNHFFLIFTAFVIFLNPYFAGPLSIISGQYFVMCFIAFFFFKIYFLEKSSFFINYKFLITVFILVTYPKIITFVSGTDHDLGMVKMNLSLLVMIMLGFFIIHNHKNFQENTELTLDLCKVFTTVIVCNALIILAEFYFPPLRVLLEGLLIPDGKVDYAEGLRFRGLASAGGASLSVAHGTGIVLMYYLFKKNSIGPLKFLISVAMVFISLIFIGRTGFVVAFIGIFLVAILIKSSREKVKLLSKAWLYIIFITGGGLLLSYATVFYDSLPVFYQNYSINVFLGGRESLSSEGTISTVIDFFSFPDNILQIFFGIGNMSGGYVDGLPADPGFMKILTGYGVLGLLVYPGLLLWCFSLPRSYLRDILIIISILLVCTEFKEPFIFKGYTSRFFWLLIGFTAYHRGLFIVRSLVKS